MNKYSVILLLFILLLTGCRPKKSLVTTFNTSSTKVMYRDTIVPLYIPGSSATAELKLEDPKYTDLTIQPMIVKTPYANATTSIVNGHITLSLVQPERVEPITIKNAIKEIHTDTKIEISKETTTELSGFDWFQIWAGRIAIALLTVALIGVALYLYIKIKPF